MWARTREYLLSAEIEVMRSAVKKGNGRHAHRDSTLILGVAELMYDIAIETQKHYSKSDKIFRYI